MSWVRVWHKLSITYIQMLLPNPLFSKPMSSTGHVEKIELRQLWWLYSTPTPPCTELGHCTVWPSGEQHRIGASIFPIPWREMEMRVLKYHHLLIPWIWVMIWVKKHLTQGCSFNSSDIHPIPNALLKLIISPFFVYDRTPTLLTG